MSGYFAPLLNIDLLFIGIAASAIGLLGFVTLLNDRTSATAHAFFFFAIMTILWNISNYLQYQFTTIETIIAVLRVNLFIATWHAFSFFHFCYVFPQDRMSYPRWYRFALLPAISGVSVLTLTPAVVAGILRLAPRGEVSEASFGPGMLLFVATTTALLVAGIVFLVVRYFKSSDGEAARQIRNVAVGMSVTGLLIVALSVALPVAFSKLSFLPLSAAFFLPFITLISYSIFKHHLFNYKIIAVQILTYVLGVFIFVEVLFASDPILLLFRGSVLVGVIGAGVLLTRSVTKEVEQRMLIEKQERELEVANKQQENLLHFISHEVKGYLTESQAGFASIADGDLGAVPEAVRNMSQMALRGVRKGVRTVMEILDASNFKKGTVSYRKETFDLKKVVADTVAELKPSADEKNLEIDVSIGDGAYMVEGDQGKLRQHVVRNLIDNAIKYTPRGTVKVSLTDGNALHFSVKDSGVGIAPDDMRNLFTEGGRGKDSIKVNVHSTGYGLFIAKQVVLAHGGKIWAESEGEGKGARFIVELPKAK